MNDDDEKKWLISRTDIVFNVRRQMIREKEKEYEQLAKHEINRWKGIEKGTISAIVVLSSIVFGINSINNTLIPRADTLIILILGIGFLTYFLTLIFRSKNENIFENISMSMSASSAWHLSYGLFNRYATEIKKYTSQDYEKFLEYSDSIVLVSTEISFYNALNKVDKSWFKKLFLSMDAYKKIHSSASILKIMLDRKSAQYEIQRKDFETMPILKRLLIYGNALTRFQNGIIISPNVGNVVQLESKLKKKLKT